MYQYKAFICHQNQHFLHVSTPSLRISPLNQRFPCRLIPCVYEWTTDRGYHGYATHAMQERGVACFCISFANIRCVTACVPKTKREIMTDINWEDAEIPQQLGAPLLSASPPQQKYTKVHLLVKHISTENMFRSGIRICLIRQLHKHKQGILWQQLKLIKVQVANRIIENTKLLFQIHLPCQLTSYNYIHAFPLQNNQWVPVKVYMSPFFYTSPSAVLSFTQICPAIVNHAYLHSLILI